MLEQSDTVVELGDGTASESSQAENGGETALGVAGSKDVNSEGGVYFPHDSSGKGPEVTSVEGTDIRFHDEQVDEVDTEGSGGVPSNFEEVDYDQDESPVEIDCSRPCYQMFCCLIPYDSREKYFVENFCLIVVGSVLGVALRVGFELLSNDSSTAFILANFLGCVVIAFANAHKSQFSYMPSYVGLCTGFCGSLTTFSSWAVTGSLIVEYPDASVGTMIYEFMQIELIGLAIGLMGYDFGLHLVAISCCVPKPPGTHDEGSTKKRKRSRACLQHPSVLFTTSIILFVVVYGIVAIATGLGQSSFSWGLLFGPPGALLRWRLAKLNAIFPDFPIGTFLANQFACLILACLYVYGYTIPKTSFVCSVTTGVINGFSGSLSTVSTWISELKTMKRRQHAYIYGFVSIITAAVIVLSIFIGTDKRPGLGTCSGVST